MRDSYSYNDCDVLKNTQGIKDKYELQEVETDVALFQLGKLHELPIQGEFNADRLRETHRRLYSDLYDWAGEICTNSNFTKGKSPDEITRSLNNTCGHMAHIDWKGKSLENQAHALADGMVEIWKERPFRKGNTLTSAEFICDFADAHGMPIEHAKFYNDPELTSGALAWAAADTPPQTSDYIYGLVEDALKIGLEKQKTITNAKPEIETVVEKVVEIKTEPKTEVVRSEQVVVNNVANKEPVNRYMRNLTLDNVCSRKSAVKDTQPEFGG